ncbi:MAG TPA: zinc metallopeptidase [Candidatus Fusicatenibacter intestinigallinarum]|uniref:Zinc metallopeptidase n=1 Tax=Candidatus Fusicatenibacter intestinigallinarum TaxID=2838598 RepID=A0A9D2NBM7_9FIRM|nr:zinc metallopeptidase [Candidatus Fusicatenibacter intestinigallinarum]
MPLFYWWDSTYILVILAALISLGVSAAMNATFQRYQGVRAYSGLTGAQTAQRILRSAGIYDVTVRHVSGKLTDHYDPRSKTVNLSDAVYGRASLAAVGVAAHECGHAIQDARGYVPLKVRGAIVPVANLGSQLFWPLFLLGLIFSMEPLVNLGILLFLFALVFQIVTLPVEFNASARAIRMLDSTGILSPSEVPGAKKVLRAAAMTYVAAVIGSLLQLLRLLILSGRIRNDD